MDVIRLKNMVFYGYHGVSDSERSLGGNFEIDFELFFPLGKPGKSDKLKDTIDYESVYQTICTCTTSKKYHLIEALGENITRTIFKKFKVSHLKLRVRKPSAPIQGILDTVEIEIERKRQDYV